MSRTSMPDGVDTPAFVASKVNAGLKRARSVARRKEVALDTAPIYFSSGISGAPKPTKEDRARAKLLDAARRGTPAAVRELRAVFHAWIIPGLGKGVMDRENPHRDKGKHGGGALDDGPAAHSTHMEE